MYRDPLWPTLVVILDLIGIVAVFLFCLGMVL